MLLSTKINSFVERLNACSELKSCKIIKAYPYSMKPTNLKSTVIAVSVGEIASENVEIGGEELCGKYKINAYIYSPYKMNDFNNIISLVINSQLNAYPSAVSVSEISNSDDLECLFVNCSFTFFDSLDFGGDENE